MLGTKTLQLLYHHSTSDDLVLEKLNEYCRSVHIGCTASTVLRRTGKSIIVAGESHSAPVAIKICTDTELYWQSRFLQEINIYEYLKQQSLAIDAPKLIHADRDCYIMVVERVYGEPVCKSAYLDSPIDKSIYQRVFTVLESVSLIQPAECPAHENIELQYIERFSRYQKLGYILDADIQLLKSVLAMNWCPTYAHADPNFSNFLLTDKRLVLIDWEFADYYLPLFDFAALSVFGFRDKELIRAIETHLQSHREQYKYFLVNKLAILSREIRTHYELLAGHPFSARTDDLRAELAETRKAIYALNQ